MSLPWRRGDLLAVMSAGAYGMAMSSNYNTRPRAAEVMVDGNQLSPHPRAASRWRNFSQRSGSFLTASAHAGPGPPKTGAWRQMSRRPE